MTAFHYSKEQRSEILEAISLRDSADSEVVIGKLTDAADRLVERRKLVRSTPSKEAVKSQLKKLATALNALDPRVREMVDHFLGEHQVTLNDVSAAVERADSERAWWFPSGRGRKNLNLSAEYFLHVCAVVWRAYDTRQLPNTVKTESPFARFCEAAMPDELRTRKAATVTALINRVVDPNYIRRRHRSM